MEYCLLQKCRSFEEHETKCHRTEECEEDGMVCRVPGVSVKHQCAKCKNGEGAEKIKGCKCGEALYCSDCDTVKTTCTDCILNYNLIDEVCTKRCAIGETLEEKCACDDVVCIPGLLCTQNADQAKVCGAPGEQDNCLIGDYRIPNCVECMTQHQFKCQQCNEGYELKIDGSICAPIDDC